MVEKKKKEKEKKKRLCPLAIHLPLSKSSGVFLASLSFLWFPPRIPGARLSTPFDSIDTRITWMRI